MPARPNHLRIAALLLSAAAFGGCATRADLLQVKQEVRETRALVADQQVAVEGLRKRLEMLKGEMTEKQGRSGRPPLSADAQQRLAELEARMAAIDQGRVVVPTESPPSAERSPVERMTQAPAAPPTPTTPKVMSAQDTALAKEDSALQGSKGAEDYREALQMIRTGQCAQAVPKLRDFIRKNPKSDFADNAQYWIGSCYYEQRDYNRAIIELNEVLLKYPKADKVPASLLMLADAFADSGDKIDARLILQKLISDHPHAEETERGRQKLQSLGD